MAGTGDRRTEKITLWGVVQGVGFRPFVAKLAARMGMRGSVRNTGGLVEIRITDDAERRDRFVAALTEELPPPADIVHAERELLPETTAFDDFSITESATGGDEAAVLPPDIAVCEACLAELDDPGDPRREHPFISCMVCGPRYTIIDRLPYDRNNTSMDAFDMCARCRGEYTDLTDRRYHAQTVSCHDCGPVLLWRENAGAEDPAREPARAAHALERAAETLAAGGVVAVKVTGGYCFVCSPFSDEAVSRLRAIKVREEKPFAVLFADADAARAYGAVSDEEAKLLRSRARPIVLLERAERAAGRERLSPGVCVSSRQVGAFLPSMGLQYLLVRKLGPLVMTSANLSDLPIIKDDAEMAREMAKQPLIAGMLYNERDIRVRMDDSVARVIDGEPRMVRRAKGYVPTPFYLSGVAADAPDVLAFGGHLKSTFTLAKDRLVYVSQAFGDLDSTESEAVYEAGLRRMAELFRVRPTRFVCDLHPRYATTRMAEARTAESPERLLRVQHHHAHIASVMAEHGLQGPVIGVAFDGTGYGTDGRVWGGEFLLCEGAAFRRAAHLRYVPMIGGDASVRDARKSAICYAHAFEKTSVPDHPGSGGAETDTCPPPKILSPDIAEILAYGQNRAANGAPERAEHEARAALSVRAALDAGVNTVESSSAGRLFDAVASLLGICQENRYEGECAIMTENAAWEAAARPGRSRAGDLALRFHEMLADLIAETCRELRSETGVRTVALSGGVFQNRLLTEGALRRLRRDGFQVYLNARVPSNDGGISLGQAHIGRATAALSPRA